MHSSHFPSFLNYALSSVFRRSFAVLIVVFVCATTLFVRAQDAANKRGFHPGNSYSLGDFETINTTNGNVMLRFPLGSLGAGRGDVNASINLVYNSKLYDGETEYFRNELYPCEYPPQDEAPYPGHCPYYTKNVLKPSEEGGWQYFLGFQLKMEDRRSQYANVPYLEQPQCRDYYGGVADGYLTMTYVHKLFVIFPDGSKHEMIPNTYANDMLQDRYFRVRHDGVLEDCGGYQQHTGSAMAYHSVDGTFVRLEFSYDGDWNPNNNTWTLYFPDGSRYDSITNRLYDRNNNYVQFGDGVSDQFGRSITMGYDAETGEDIITSKGFAGEDLVWRIKWKTLAVSKKYNPYPEDVAGCALGHTCPPSTDPESVGRLLRVVDKITLPSQAGSNLSYTFSYNAPDYTGGAFPTQESVGFGEVSAITLPSGGATPAHATYSYYLDGEENVGSAFRYTREVLKDRITAKHLTYLQEYDGAAAPVTENWGYDIQPGGSTITGPDGSVTTEAFGWTEAESWTAGLSLVSIAPNGTKVEKLWAQNCVHSFNCGVQYATNPYVKTEFTSLRNVNGSYTLTAIKDYNYDKNGNVTRVAEYDFVPYSSVPRDSQGNVTGLPAGITPTRVSTSTYAANTPDANDWTTSPYYSYIFSQSHNLRAVSGTEIADGSGNVKARTEFAYDNALTTANLTQKTSWDSTKGPLGEPPLNPTNSISVANQYDAWSNGATGKLAQTTDAKGNSTVFTYGAITGFDLYPTQIQTAYGTPIQRTETRSYDFYTGLTTSVTDADNNVTTSTLYDAFGRPTLVKAADGKSEETRTVSSYSDIDRRIIISSDLNTVGDAKLVTIQHYDQLGRIRLTRQLEDAANQNATDETVGIKVQTRYKFSDSNSYQVSSAPFREASSLQATTSEMNWTRSKADNTGRLVEVKTFGGVALPAPWAGNTNNAGQVNTSYDANTVTVTDQADKKRRSVTDGLGRLIRVDEPDKNSGSLDDQNGQPIQATYYTYDALDNLIQVTQGDQMRTYTYDSLKRLTSATNPESGTVCYGHVVDNVCQGDGYDANGNLIYKTDARGVLATYTYDELNRNTGLSYSSDPANTPSVTRTYDNPATGANGLGRLWKTQTAGTSTTTIDAYDALGRPRSMTQTMGGYSFVVARTYDLAGHVLSQTYPSQHVVNYSYDTAGRLNDSNGSPAFSGNLGDGVGRTYTSALSYNPAGRMTSEQLGTGTTLFNKLAYNLRGQLAEIRVGTDSNATSWDRGFILNDYSSQCSGAGCNGSDNNGNLLRQTVSVPDDEQNTSATSWYQTYSYDQLNRLTRVSEFTGGGQPAWQQSFAYDRFGNRSINLNANATFGYGVNGLQFEIDPATNRQYAANDPSHSLIDFDAAGNQIKDYYTGNGARTYDAENRLIAAQDNSGGWTYYKYDGDGRRVRVLASTATGSSLERWVIYGFDGEMIADYNENPWNRGKLVNLTGEYGYRNGQLLIKATIGTTLFAGIGGLFENPTVGEGNYESNPSGGGWSFTGSSGIAGNGSALTSGNPNAPEGNQVAFIQGGSGSVISTLVNAGDVAPGVSYAITFSAAQRANCCSNGGEDFKVLVYGAGIGTQNLGTFKPSGADYQEYTTSVFVPQTNGGLHISIVGVNSAGGDNTALIDNVRIRIIDNVEWLVSDQLGTPRMIFDKTGSLDGMSRHDYLPFGEELFAGTGGRTPQQGYSASDGVRQKFTEKERDNETGLDYFEARYYSSVAGRFTSVDPVLINDNRLVDPQQINLYHYTRNNPLRWTDPTGETIVENIDDKYKEDYEKWKKALLATKAGQALWDKYNNDKSFTLNITVSKDRGNGALTDNYTFDSNGKLNGARITLGSKLGQEAPPQGLGYLVTGSLTESDPKRVAGTPIDDLTRAVGKFAHEFGHVEDAQARPALFQLLQQYNQRANGLTQLQLQTDPQLNQLRNQLGGDMDRIGHDNEVRADRAAVPVLQERFGKGMPARVKDAMKKIQDYQKAHP